MNGAVSGTLAALAAVVMVPVAVVLAISGDSALSGCGVPVGVGGDLAESGTFTDDMAGYASTIVQVGIDLGVPPRGQVIALSTALVESDMRNLPGGDRDSVGLFQQRPSQGWGTVAELTTPSIAASRFYEALLKINNWTTRDPGEVAQSVQRSAFPDRYGERMTQATQVYATVTGEAGSAQPLQDLGDYQEGDPASGIAAMVDNCEVGATTGNIVEVPTPAGGSIQVDQALEGPLTQLLADAAADGIALGGGGYRDPASQVATRRSNCGSSQYAIYQMPSSQCRPPTAIPGTSQHELGLAIDFSYQGKTVCFPRATCTGNAAYDWLIANAERYGLKKLQSEAWHYSSTGR